MSIGLRGVIRLLLAVLPSTALIYGAIVRGPTNVVGIHHESVTLRCHSDPGQQVKWTFRRFGRTQTVDISGDHSTSWSSRGAHSLTFDSLTFYNAGKYVSVYAIGPGTETFLYRLDYLFAKMPGRQYSE